MGRHYSWLYVGAGAHSVTELGFFIPLALEDCQPSTDNE